MLKTCGGGGGGGKGAYEHMNTFSENAMNTITVNRSHSGIEFMKLYRIHF